MEEIIKKKVHNIVIIYSSRKTISLKSLRSVTKVNRSSNEISDLVSDLLFFFVGVTRGLSHWWLVEL